MGCSEMVLGQKLACTEAAKEISSTLVRGSHAIAWLGSNLKPSGTQLRGNGFKLPTSDDHNFFVRTPFWVLLDSMESPLSKKFIHI